MATRWGTSHFESIGAAIQYYRPYHYSDTAKAVERKIAEGEIHIGKPEAKPGQTVTLDSEEGRYFIEETEKDVFRPYEKAAFVPGSGCVTPVEGYAYKRTDGTLWNLDRIDSDFAHLWTVNAWGATHWEHVTEAQFRRDWRLRA